jgi:hypothetical protein
VQQVSPGYDDNQALSLVIAQAGNNVQLYQNGIPLEVGTKYRLSFAAYSSTGNGMDVELQQHGAPYASYGLNTHISLSTSWALYSVEFAATVQNPVSDGRLMFWLAPYASSGDRYFIDGVVLEKVGSTSVTPPTGTAPLSYALKQNYPNPFNPTTTIQYSTASSGKVVLRIFNILGEEVTTLVKGVQEAGEHVVRFDAGLLPAGTYFCRLETANFRETKKMLLVK